MDNEKGFATLDQLCDLISTQRNPGDVPDATYFGLEHLAPGRMRPVAQGRASEVQSHKFAFQLNDVLYGKLRPYLDKAVLAECDGVCTTELLVLRPKNGVDPRYLACLVHAPEFISKAMSGVTGAQHPRTSWNNIAQYEVPKRNVREQAAIANLLWSIHDLLVGCEAATGIALELKQAAMRELYTRGLRGESLKDTELGLLPESWKVITLGSLGKIGNGSTPKRSVPAYWDGGTFPWLTSAKMYDREIEAAAQFVTDTALDECHLPRVKPGAVLMAITGQGKTLGHCAVLKIEASISQHVAYVQIDTEKADSGFIRGYLETQYEYLRQVAAGGGSTKGALTCAFLKGLPVPLPSMDEQLEILTILDAIDSKVILHRQKRSVLEDLFRCLLHRLISGEISVENLDLSAPSPASKLLEEVGAA